MNMASDTLYAALFWINAPSETRRREIEAEARRAAKGADPLGAAEAEEATHQEAWVQAKWEFERLYAAYAASKSEEDRLEAGHAQLALESAGRYLRAAMIAKEFVAAALVAA
jgi:hypothetical protein